MPAGYPGTPLVRKLGIKKGMRVLILNAPRAYPTMVADLPESLEFATGGSELLDMIHLFTTSAEGLHARLQTLRAQIRPAGVMWVSWPKKASRMSTDVSEDVIRNAALNAGLVDVKVCAIDSTWSGLKLVIRTADRPALSAIQRRKG